ncbi:DUF3679 domain-containing protein [Microaerobacter geothermalis]|uniref:DUF3679 domain-containing protein n=1 Tax=Microaerobacter geothermalis TaxID=674972 RepID=UPI001F21AEAC|nr:DUF3679 domain-containing protein [Microaerobacter geothermalis]MCF6092869.1 DUF3679 domain-containing protein [Microaerobacter geothermalis]
MKKFLIQLLLLVVFLLSGVILGIKTSEVGISRIQPLEKNIPAPFFHITKVDGEKVEVAPNKENQKESDNPLLTIEGKTSFENEIGYTLTKATRKGLEWISSLIPF